MIKKKKERKTMKIEVFEKWLSECPVNWVQTDNGLNLTETYEFDLSDCEFDYSEFKDFDTRNDNKEKL
jgi:hypothetical protein